VAPTVNRSVVHDKAPRARGSYPSRRSRGQARWKERS
jgi:hypothetical protein